MDRSETAPTHHGKVDVIGTTFDRTGRDEAVLFRFRATAGQAIHGIEPYVGYEYLDIDRLHHNSLIAGVHVWF
ncbi:MAG: hypothetical protein JW818_17070 [Pirellulales bacterium]|nr:hypothetical protein [Pirellulales bacterium]